MAQAYPSYTEFTLRHEFQISLLWKFIGGEPMRTGDMTGEFEITIDMDENGGNWIITDFWVNADNGKMGDQANGGLYRLDGDETGGDALSLLIVEAIENQYASRIEAWVQDELASRRYTFAA